MQRAWSHVLYMTCLQRMYPTAWSSPTRHFVIAVKACKASVNAKQGHVTLLRAGEPNSQRDCKITDGVDSSLDYLQPEHNPRQFNAYIGVLLLLRTYCSCVLQLQRATFSCHATRAAFLFSRMFRHPKLSISWTAFYGRIRKNTRPSYILLVHPVRHQSA